LDDYDSLDSNWNTTKKNFLQIIEEYFNQIEQYDDIDIALVSIISLIKKEYGNFKLSKHHYIYPIKKYNNINWAKEPYRKIQDKFYELSAPGQLISKNSSLNFSNRICNEYEVYTANIRLLKISGDDITKEKVEQSNIYLIPKEEDKILLIPYLIFFFFRLMMRNL
jgi:hypothetical protein